MNAPAPHRADPSAAEQADERPHRLSGGRHDQAPVAAILVA